MASIAALNKNPTFMAKVGVPQAGAESVEVAFTFRYRTKKELDEFDKWVKDKSDVVLMQAIVEGWDFEEPYNAENIELLLQRSIGSGWATLQTYRSELVKLRLKN